MVVCLRGDLSGNSALLDHGQVAGDNDQPLCSGLDRGSLMAGDVEEAAWELADRIVLLVRELNDLCAGGIRAFTDERDQAKERKRVCRGLDRFVLGSRCNLRVSDLLLKEGHWEHRRCC